jgi:hypothetical protein
MKLYSLDYLRIAETRSTQEPIFILRQTGEKLLRKRKKIHVCFIRVDLKKVFDRIKRNNVWNSMRQRRLKINTIAITQLLLSIVIHDIIKECKEKEKT